MKYKIITSVLLLFSSLILIACQPVKETGTEPIMGKKVKMATTYKVNPQTGEKRLRDITYFNKEGKKTKRVDYKENELWKDVIFEYDKQDNLIKVTEKEGAETTILGTYTYKEGFMIQEKTPYGYTFFEYNDRGDFIEEKTFNTDETIDLFLFYEYKYEGDKLLAKLTYEQREAGVEKQKRQLEQFAYNDKGQVVKRRLVSVYDERLFTHTYHPNGKRKKTIELAFENKEKVVHHFNTDGEKTKVEVYRRKTTEDEFQLDLTNYRVYNEFGDLVEQKSERKGVTTRQVIIELVYY